MQNLSGNMLSQQVKKIYAELHSKKMATLKMIVKTGPTMSH